MLKSDTQHQNNHCITNSIAIALSCFHVVRHTKNHNNNGYNENSLVGHAFIATVHTKINNNNNNNENDKNTAMHTTSFNENVNQLQLHGMAWHSTLNAFSKWLIARIDTNTSYSNPYDIIFFF